MYRAGGSIAVFGRLKTVPPVAFHGADFQPVEGVMGVTCGDVFSGSAGLTGGGDERSGGASRVFGVHRDMVHKMLVNATLQGYTRQSSPRRPRLEPFTGVIDAILEADRRVPKKQRHTVKRIFERLRDEYGFDGQHAIVKDYVREHGRRVGEMFVPLSRPPGHAQCDFGEAVAVIAGVEREVHYFVLDLPHSDGCFVKAYPAETTEAFLDGHVSAFAFLGGSPQSILYDNPRLAVAKILDYGRRKRTRAFTELQSHYLFEDRFGRSGKGNDKGKVEGMVGYARRNFLVPVPRAESFQALNAHWRGGAWSGWTPCCGDTPRPSASGWSGTWRRCWPCRPRPTTPASSRPAGSVSCRWFVTAPTTTRCRWLMDTGRCWSKATWTRR